MDRILFVDDDVHVLRALTRGLRKHFDVETAAGPGEGLAKIASGGPYAVVVSDLRMPGIDGIEFLTRVRRAAPDTVRVMLTGYADLEAAMAAVNEGNTFRFLTKPVQPQALRKALEAAVAQYRLITAQQTFMRETLGGSLELLNDVLAAVSPPTLSRSLRIRRFIRHMSRALQVPKAWQYGLAAELSQVGCITLPRSILEKVDAGEALTDMEERVFAEHPAIAAQLIAHIPRLDAIAQMVAAQQQPFREAPDPRGPAERPPVLLGGHMLKIAHDFDQLLARGLAADEALDQMSGQPDQYDPALVQTLRSLRLDTENLREEHVQIDALDPGMILAQDIVGVDELTLAVEGQQVTAELGERLRRLARLNWVVGPIRVRIAAQTPAPEEDGAAS